MSRERAMLWLPGWGMPDSFWDKVRERFSAFQHVSPDFSGVSRPDEFAEAVEKEVGLLGATPVIAIGWSMGGLLAQRLAARHQVAGLVLVSTTARFVRSREERTCGWTDAHLRRMQRSLAEDGGKVLGAFRESMLTDEERRRAAPMLSQRSSGEWTHAALMAGLSYLRKEDCRSSAPALSCPAAIVHGTEDEICPYAAGVELASLIPGASLFPVVGGGHVPLVFRPEIVIEAVERVVESCVETDRFKPV
ncbi:alpha/beta fold hydrolase [Brevibacillus brevis]|uniref:Alpha/beta fold hydrolase n=1 Tax=Brevibacillus brevis TaxID=1393 RepID=A0ABY9T376_BREBE|nr:alpha/beta fold hydrolase [Brevibacillus brevis]WNC14536.1 alpha/beta fold hydrolase [Brevibacillus brevis]